MTRRFWKIEGYDGTDRIFETAVKLGLFSENQMIALLKALVSRAGLSNEEIVGAYARIGTAISNQLLEVHRSMHGELMCGTDPHFIAKVVDEHDL